MTNSPSIVPSETELRQWELLILDEEENVDVVLIQAFQAGADQELEACCEWLSGCGCNSYGRELRAARRPKPPSLKEQALADFNWLVGRALVGPGFDERSNRIRRALEALPDD